MAGHGPGAERPFIRMIERELESNGVDRYKFIRTANSHLVLAFEVRGIRLRLVFGASTDPRAMLNARGQLRRMVRQAREGEAA